jgi:hypothetical protein
MKPIDVRQPFNMDNLKGNKPNADARSSTGASGGFKGGGKTNWELKRMTPSNVLLG